MKLILLFVLIAVSACSAKYCDHGLCFNLIGPDGKEYPYRRSMSLEDLMKQKDPKDLPAEASIESDDDDVDFSQVSKPVMRRALWNLIWPLMQQYAEQMPE